MRPAVSTLRLFCFARPQVPKNHFGNVDLECAAHLPRGCTHLVLEGIEALAEKMGVDHARARTGFETKNRETLPKFKGIVVCDEAEPRRKTNTRHQSERAARGREGGPCLRLSSLPSCRSLHAGMSVALTLVCHPSPHTGRAEAA